MAKYRDKAMLKRVRRVVMRSGAKWNCGTVHEMERHCRLREGREMDLHTRKPRQRESAWGI